MDPQLFARSCALSLGLCAFAGACDRDGAPLPAAATASVRPQVADKPYRVAPSEKLSKEPVLALRQWTQGRIEDVPDIPLFTLFDDGSVVAWRERNGRAGFVEAQLGDDGRRILMEVRSSGLAKAPRVIHGEVRATHTPETTIVFRDGDGWRHVSVEGFYEGAMIAGQTHQPPDGFSKVYHRLVDHPLPEAAPWQHHHLRVHLRATTSGEALPWPTDLPRPGADALRRNDGVQYVISVAHEKQARAALEAARPFEDADGRWQLVAVEPTLEAHRYLSRVWSCGRDPHDC